MEVPIARPPSRRTDALLAVYMLSIHGREVEGAVVRVALEEHFWLSPDAEKPKAT
ncbi:hypothetical protein [Paraburkholderia sediminicola]|uniref:hypothetical protein n=1 Tax=Paraburkholderia sediminicola TaxID=458836 RepID=UPI0038BADB6A